MSIPFEIQLEIIKHLPVISLIRFRSVCKSWKSSIDSSRFIAAYKFNLHSPHLLINYELCESYETKYVCFVDDDSFPQKNFIYTIPPIVQQLNNPSIIGSCQGLLCSYGFFDEPEVPEKTARIVVWNPAIRKLIVISGLHDWDRSVVGFGVCPKTSDVKIVKITNNNLEDTNFQQVQVFSSRLGEWRITSSNLLPRKSIQFRWLQAVIGQCIYWLAYEKIDEQLGFDHRNLIISFDMCTEEFKEVHLPGHLADTYMLDLSICKLRESLLVLKYNENVIGKRVCDVWTMEDGDRKNFRNLFTINPSQDADDISWVLGFRKNGEAIVEMIYDDEADESKVAIYEPGSQHFNNLGIHGYRYSFLMNNIYNESLLLLDHGNGYIA